MDNLEVISRMALRLQCIHTLRTLIRVTMVQINMATILQVLVAWQQLEHKLIKMIPIEIQDHFL